ncbi:unknown [Firmicutes bacterium CAG:555]|nr:unknown [Firmicutes bacterium CAG:555]
MAVNGLILIAGHGVLVNECHAVFKLLERSLAVGKLCRTGCKLLFACLELICACGKLLLGGLELCFALGKLLLACCKLSLCGLESLLALCDLLLAGLERCQTVLILLELSLAVSDHLLHVFGEVGDILGDGQTGLLGEGTNLAHEPCLSGVKAGNLCNGAVTELDIGIEQRHERLDLGEHCLAFIVSLGIGIDELLTLCDLLLAGLKFLLALFVLGIALCQGLLALLICGQTLFVLALTGIIGLLTCGKLFLAGRVIAQTLCVGADAFIVRIFVFFQKCDSILKLTDNICCLCIVFLVLLDGQTVLHAETDGDEAEQADNDKKNAHNGGKRCFLHFFPLNILLTNAYC